MAVSREFEQNIGNQPENESGYFIGRKIPLEEREKLWQEPTPPIPEGLIEPVLTSNAIHVLERRYLRKENGKVVETPQEMFRRVADSVARVETLYVDNEEEGKRLVEERRLAFYEMMARLDFLPNSPTLMNAGKRLQQLSACFVVPIEDSMADIFEAVKLGALIHQSGGGTGYSFSRLREEGSVVKSTGGRSSGPLSFMRVFNEATDTVIQGGTRRGANMGILRVDHPDIIAFIKAKDEQGEYENFNLSVGLTKEFKEVLKEEGRYSLISPLGYKTGEMDAREVLDLIAERTWRRGDPGIVDLDRINEDNPTPHLGKIESTNPCGEQPLLPFESCNLGSINLAKFVKDGDVDWERIGETVHLAVNFLDNVIDANRYPIPQIEEMTLGNRKIGLGIMGLADMLIKLGLPYNSEEARKKAGNVMQFIQDEGRKASMGLSQERGVFPNFEESIYEQKGIPIRNATITTIAPTGSISIIAGSSSGCEPLFALAFESTRRLGETEEDNILWEVNPLFLEMARKAELNEGVIKAITERGRIVETDDVPDWMRDVFVTALQISPEDHLRMQAVLQRFTDNAVSKTINLPNETTVEEIKVVYLLALELGLKGLTLYRDRSRDEQVLSAGKKREEVVLERRPRPRPETTHGITEKIEVGCGQTIYVTVNEDDVGLCEVFTQMGKSGGCMASQSEAIGRLISLALRSGVDAETIVKQLRGIRCPSPQWREGQMVLSCADAIGQAIERYTRIKEGLSPELPPPSLITSKLITDTFLGRGGEDFDLENIRGLCPECPDCGGMVEFTEGCLSCPACGYSQCE